MTPRKYTLVMPWIYYLKDPRDDSVRYIGYTTHPESRLREHLRDARSSKTTHKVRWIRSLQALGLLPVWHLEAEFPPECIHAKEREYIAMGRSEGWYLTNATDGGEGVLNYRHSEETRAKIGAAHRSLSPASLARMGAAQKGRVHSAETITKMRASYKNLSPETRANIKAGQVARRARERSARQEPI